MKITISWFKNVFTENSIDRRTLVFCHFFPKFSENMRILMSITFHWKLWWSSREDQLQRNWPLSDRLPIHIYFFSSLLVFLFHKGYYNTTKKCTIHKVTYVLVVRAMAFFRERQYIHQWSSLGKTNLVSHKCSFLLKNKATFYFLSNLKRL